jgi:hypothetical protein
MKRLVLFALILGIALSVAGPGIGQEEEPDADLSELVAEMAELLDQALYLSIAALSWPDRDDLELYIQGIVNLLDGPGSPDYDASGGAATPNEDGLKDLFLTFLTARSGVETVATPHASLSILAQAVQAAEHTERYLFLAAEAAKAARDRVYSVTGGRQELRQTYAYLLAARGKTSDELLLGGLGTLLEVFPSLDIWVGPDESIQAAIDRAPAGATIHLEPGTYRERIVIDKDLTLIGEPAGETDRPMVELIGVIWDIVVGIEGDGVEVHLRNLYVSNGTVGILASGNSTVHLHAVWIGQVNSAVTATDGAIVHCDDCEFAESETAMLVRSGASAHVSNSILRDCASMGIIVFFGGSLTMTDTTVSGCGGDAIYLQDDSTLHLERCSIYGNEGFGVFAYTAECERHFIIGQTDERGFTGTITGANNTIPDPDEEHGNLEGDICPEEYRFLKGGGPIIVPPGESD